MNDKRWLSVSEVADYFSIRRGTVYDLIGRGRLPEGSVLRLGRQIRLNVERLEAAAFEKGGRR